MRLTSRASPRPGTSASNGWRSTVNPYSSSSPSTQSAAPREPVVPGERSGNRRAISFANWTAVVWSNVGGSAGGGNGCGRATLKAATRSGTVTSAQAAR